MSSELKGAEISGKLLKLSQKRGKYNQRVVSVRDGVLSYRKSLGAVKRIPIDSDCEVGLTGGRLGGASDFHVNHKNKKLVFRARTPDEAAQWVSRIKSASKSSGVSLPSQFKHNWHVFDPMLLGAAKRTGLYVPHDCSSAVRVNFERLDSDERALATKLIGSSCMTKDLPTEEEAVAQMARAISELVCSGDPREIYQNRKHIAKGGFSDVYMATSVRDHSVVAIKVANKEDSDENIEIMLSEVSCLHALGAHQSIIQPKEVYVFDEQAWFVMEYAEGGSLAQFITYKHTLREALIANICCQALQALDRIHTHHFLHCDLKSDNFLLCPNGALKLVDFGLSVQLTTETGYSMRRSRCGTSHWMAPEIVESRLFSESSDIWSLGITVLEMVQGRPPRSSLKEEELFKVIVNEPSPTLPLEGNWSPSFRDFVDKLLRKDHTERPSAATLLFHPFLRSMCSVAELAFEVSKAKRDREEELLWENYFQIGVVVTTFKAREDGQLPLKAGHEVTITSRKGDMFRGMCRQTGLKGFFPAAHIQILEPLGRRRSSGQTRKNRRSTSTSNPLKEGTLGSMKHSTSLSVLRPHAGSVDWSNSSGHVLGKLSETENFAVNQQVETAPSTPTKDFEFPRLQQSISLTPELSRELFAPPEESPLPPPEIGGASASPYHVLPQKLRLARKGSLQIRNRMPRAPLPEFDEAPLRGVIPCAHSEYDVK